MTKKERKEVARLLAQANDMRPIRMKVLIECPTQSGTYFTTTMDQDLVINNEAAGDLSCTLAMQIVDCFRAICKSEHGGKTIVGFDLAEIATIEKEKNHA